MPRKSPLADKNLLEEAINNCDNQADVLRYLGLRAAGGNNQNLKKWAKIHSLNLPELDKQASMARAKSVQRTFTNEEVFVQNSAYSNRTHIKSRLRKLWTDWICSECGVGEVWNSKSLVLQLDHINGVHNDHRLENLRLLCPNCHSQTDTFCGKNK